MGANPQVFSDSWLARNLLDRESMTPRRLKSAALSLATAIVVLSGGAVFAQGDHPYCSARQHACDKAARISACCCGDQDASWTDSAPVQSRVEARADTTTTPAAPPFARGRSITPVPIAPRISPSPPGWCLIDFPTLFASLLI
jgi:hypothetical protein